MIVPQVKIEKQNNTLIKFGNKILVFASDLVSKKVFDLMSVLIEDIEFESVDSPEQANVILKYRIGLSYKKEFYKIETCDNVINIYYEDFLGGRNAIATLMQLINKTEYGFEMFDTYIEDWPDTADYRGFLITDAYDYNTLKNYILIMARSKMKYLHWHILDAIGYAIKSDVYPELEYNGEKDSSERLSKTEVREIVKFANSIGIEVIPELDFPGHCKMLTKVMPQLKCQTKSMEASEWVLCAGNEQVYSFIENILTEISEVFTSKYIHVGTDEIAMMNTKNRSAYPTWHDCERCQELCERENISSVTEIFYYFVKRIYGIVKKLGKKMIMWNDNINIAESPDLPRDIIIEFWRVSQPDRGPIDGCSMKRFLEEGFKVINTFYRETYVDNNYLYGHDLNEKIRRWSPMYNPYEHKDFHKPVIFKDGTLVADLDEQSDWAVPNDKELARAVIGGEFCAWGNHSHYERCLPSLIALYADRMWCHKPFEITNEFGCAITKILFGYKVPSGFNVFGILGGIALPSDNDVLGYPEKSNTEFEYGKTVLNSIKPTEGYYYTIAHNYLKCIEWIENNMS